MAVVAVSIAPLGTAKPGVSEYVAAAERVLREDGRLKYRVDPMFTTIEGDLHTILEVIERMHEALFEMGAVRVSTLIKVDDRRDKEVRMEEKVRSVEEKLEN